MSIQIGNPSYTVGNFKNKNVFAQKKNEVTF